MIKFDCAKPQEIALKLIYKGRDVEVKHVLTFPSDDRLVQYYKDRKVTAKLSAKGLDSDDQLFEVAVKLWDEVAVSRSGYKNDDAADWKAKTKITHKESAIEALLDVRAIRPDVLDAEFLGVEDDETEVVDLEAYYNGEILKTQIVFNQPSAAQVRRFREIKDVKVRRERDAVIETSLVNLIDRAKLYDELVVDSVGYAARVPITHKAVATMALFENTIETVEKKS